MGKVWQTPLPVAPPLQAYKPAKIRWIEAAVKIDSTKCFAYPAV